MRIEVNLQQPWREVAYFYYQNKAAFDALLEKVKGRSRTFDFYGMTCGDLCTLIDGGFPALLQKLSEGLTVKGYCQLINSVRDGLKGFATYLEKTTPPTTPLQRRAAAGMMETTTEEMILLQLKDFYTLHSLEDAQKLTVYEFMIARKAEYNQRLAEYNMQKIMEHKSKQR